MGEKVLTVKEAIIEALDGLSETEQMFLFDIVHGINNGLVSEVQYKSDTYENVTTQTVLTIGKSSIRKSH